MPVAENVCVGGRMGVVELGKLAICDDVEAAI